MSHARALVGSWVIVSAVAGCTVAERVRGWIEAEPAVDDSESGGEAIVDEAAETMSPDAVALAEALLPAPTGDAAPPQAAAPAPIAELELRDLELEWTDRGGHYYGYHPYGSAEAPKVLRVGGVAKVTAAVGEKAEVLVKASCDDGGWTVTDADISTIDDSYVTKIPAPGTEFRIATRIFLASPPSDPSACRVTVTLRDASRTPARRGRIERCWSAAAKRPFECTPEALPLPAEASDAWSVADAQFLPTGELGFSVVAGRTRAPDRVAVRATCHAGEKHFVEFKYLTGRWYSLEPGESLRQREQLQSSWEFMRYTDCDVEIEDVGYDFDKQTIRGMKAIAKLCSRPLGLRPGGCRTTAPEPPAPDPSGVPAKLEIQHGGSNAYAGWYNAYVMAELTVLSAVPAGATLDFVAHCGSRSEKQQVMLQTPLELVYPGQSLRAQGNVSFSAKVRAKTCTTEMVLSAKDASGTPVSWSLGKQCYDKWGSITACPGSPPKTTLGFSGVIAGHGRIR